MGLLFPIISQKYLRAILHVVCWALTIGIIALRPSAFHINTVITFVHRPEYHHVLSAKQNSAPTVPLRKFSSKIK